MKLTACASLPVGPLTGVWSRAIRHQHQDTPLQTSHSLESRSRFSAGPRAANPFEVLYLAEHAWVSHMEVGEVLGDPFNPQTIVAAHEPQAVLTFPIQVSLQRVVDLTDPAVRARLDVSFQELLGPWAFYQYLTPPGAAGPPGEIAPTQALGQALFDTPGVEGLLTLSAPMPTHRNLVLFPQKLLPGSSLATTLGGVPHRIEG